MPVVAKDGLKRIIHELLLHVRVSLASPGQLLLKTDAAGF